jgi:hypothetical protein
MHNMTARPEMQYRRAAAARWFELRAIAHLGDERTARRRGTEVQGISARERKDDNETAEHRLGE